MSKIYERLSSLTPLLQGKQVNYLPAMVGALRRQGIEDKDIQKLVESFMKIMPVGDLGEKLYPKSIFDEYYIHKTNFYLGQLRTKSFEELFNLILQEENDMGATYEFAGLLRVMYALQSEEELVIAEALAFFDLSTLKKQLEDPRTISIEKTLKDMKNRYDETPSRTNLVVLMNLLAIENLASYIHNLDDVLSRYVTYAKDIPEESDIEYPTLEEIMKQDVRSFDDPLLMIMYDLLSNE